MPRTCVIRGCNSNRFTGSEYTPTFTFPTQAARYKQWFHLINPKQDPNLFIGVYDTVCINHFEENYICRTTVAFDSNLVKHTVPRNKLCLTKDAVPTLNLDLQKDILTISDDDSNSDDDNKNTIKFKTKKQLSSTLGINKSRSRKNKRRERVKNLIKGRPTIILNKPDVKPLVQEIRNVRKQTFVRSEAAEEMELEDNVIDDEVEIIEKKDFNPKYNVKVDYLLGSKTESTDEMLVVNLRLHSLIKPLRDGIQLCKNPTKFETNNVYPTLNLVHQIQGFENAAMNPVFWSTDQVFAFIKHISTSKNVPKTFKLEDIDGAALMNLSKTDLMKYMHFSSSTAGPLSETIKHLRNETIQKFLNVKA